MNHNQKHYGPCKQERDPSVTCKVPTVEGPMQHRPSGRDAQHPEGLIIHLDLKRIGSSQHTHLEGTNRHETKATTMVTGSHNQVLKTPGHGTHGSREKGPMSIPKAKAPKRQRDILNPDQRSTDEENVSPDRAK